MEKWCYFYIVETTEYNSDEFHVTDCRLPEGGHCPCTASPRTPCSCLGAARNGSNRSSAPSLPGVSACALTPGLSSGETVRLSAEPGTRPTERPTPEARRCGRPGLTLTGFLLWLPLSADTLAYIGMPTGASMSWNRQTSNLESLMVLYSINPENREFQ